MECGGFIHNQAILREEDEHAKEGTAEHEEVERRCREGILEADYKHNNFVDFYIRAKKKGATLIVEEYVKNEYLKGKPDLVAFFKDTMYVVDLKNGFMAVEPTSWQLVGYALLFLKPNIKKVVCAISQNGAFKTIEYTIEELMEKKAQILAKFKDNSLALGDHCQFCDRCCPLQQAAIKEALGFAPSLTTLVDNKADIAKWLKKAEGGVMALTEAPTGYYFDTKTTSRRSINIGTAPEILTKKAAVSLQEADTFVKLGVLSEEDLNKHITTKTSKTKKLYKKRDFSEETVEF